MKLVRKNDEFIVIESNGSYHKVALDEIDDLILLLCEARRVDPAKANKSIGENLFEDQARVTRLAGQYVDELHRKYGRVRQMMGIPLVDIYAKLKALMEENRLKNKLDDDTHFDAWVEAATNSRESLNLLEDPDMLVMSAEFKEHPRELMEKWVNNNRRSIYPLVGPTDVILGVDPSAKGDMTMSIVKGREVNANGQSRPDTSDVHLLYGDLPFTPPLEQAGVSFSIRNSLKFADQRKVEEMTPLKQAMMKTFEEKLPGRVNQSPYLYDDPKKPGMGMFQDLFIPRQSYKSDLRGYLARHFNYRGPIGSPLRNPLVGGKRIGMSHWPVPAPVYWPVLAAFNDRMRKQDEARYVATAFPKRFNRLSPKLPGTLYTADVAYFVLTGNPNEDITSMSQIQSKAVKAWEC